jgi:DNA-binding response OmpR family regulator
VAQLVFKPVRRRRKLLDATYSTLVAYTRRDQMQRVAKKRILVVEDNVEVGWSLFRVLEEAGYDVVAAVNGGQAVSAVRDSKFNLALIDIVLGAFDGQDVSDALLELQPDLPVLFMSGYGASGYSSLPDDRVIAKPVDARELIARVERELDDRT